jgi:hypothetical protein
LLFTLAAPLRAEPVLSLHSGEEAQMIELYTSQGCSSCPPAEKWLNELLDHPGLWKSVIPLAFHVDYWDYLGWADSYASHDHTARQTAYRSQGHISQVYTPGFVINGAEWRGWFRREALPVVKQKSVSLTAELDGEKLAVEFMHNSAAFSKPLVLNVAILGFGIETQIERGENHGKKLRQEFVVLKHESARSKNGQWNTVLPNVSRDLADRFALVLWVSHEHDLRPIQAVADWLP